ncbi:hypothetical protein KCU88_g5097, partial [Aureobasidium melanogenum]
MAYALMQLDPDPSAAKSLVTTVASTAPSEMPTDSSLDIIWNLLDYGWLSDSARPSSSPEACQSWLHGGPWDPTDKGWNPRQHDPSPAAMMQDSTTIPNDIDYFDPTVEDPTYGAWLEIIDPGPADMPADLDAEQDWSRLVLQPSEPQ